MSKKLNPTGVRPVECRVLIRVDTLETKTAGGLFLPDRMLDREQIAHDRGVLVEVSEMAFSDWTGRKPEVGDRVIFSKYAGSVIHYRTAERKVDDFRLCNDTDICAVLQEE